MEAADDRRDRIVAGELARIADGIDDPGVAAAAEDHESTVTKTDDLCLVVQDQRVRAPFAVAQGLMSLETGLERGRAVHLAGDEHRSGRDSPARARWEAPINASPS